MIADDSRHRPSQGGATSTEHLETRRETEAALAARRELGVEYEDAIAASLAERVEQLAAQRSTQNAQLAEQAQERHRSEDMSRNRRRD